MKAAFALISAKIGAAAEAVFVSLPTVDEITEILRGADSAICSGAVIPMEKTETAEFVLSRTVGMRRIRRAAETATRGKTDPTALRETMKEIRREAMTAK